MKIVRFYFHKGRTVLATVLAGFGALVCWTAGLSAQTTAPPHTLTGEVTIDMRTMSFSRYGSYMVFTQFPQGLYLRELHNNAGRGAVLVNALRVEVVESGRPINFTVDAHPTEMHLVTASGTVDLCFGEANLIRFRTHHVGLRLTLSTSDDYALQMGPQEWELHGWNKYRIAATQGRVRVDTPWNGKSGAPITTTFEQDPKEPTAEGFIGDYSTVWEAPQPATYDQAETSVRNEYRRWIAKFPPVPDDMAQTAERAAFLDWSDFVHPMGFISRPGILMSKEWMTSVWSWDQCFNAMALLPADPKAAWDQYMLPFDHQDPDGQLPDRMNDEAESFRHTKPPVHGWVLRWMMQHSDSITNDQLQQIYGPLSRWTEWFFKYRDLDHDGLPEYNHGDDAGWDNSTVFVSLPPIEAPDLAALLVIQMDVLSDVAGKLGKSAEAAAWHERSNALLDKMIAAYWHDGQFIARRALTHEETPRTSILLYLPVMLGNRLPQPIREQLLARLLEKGRFLTPNGFATEELSSPYYDPGGYWRGPIWAPTTMMLEEGVRESGRPEVARDLRERYCRMVERSGFAENFNALTGAGSVMPDLSAPDHEHRDPAYTWAASVYLIFAREKAQEIGAHQVQK